METKTRRRIEMGTRALEFSRAHRDPSPGYAAALARLEDRLARVDDLAAEQRDGTLAARAATERKDELRKEMQAPLIPHLVEAGKSAAREVPELAQKLVFRAASGSNMAFLTAAYGMVKLVEEHREVLERHGLAMTAFETLKEELVQFEAAMEQFAIGRQRHVGASAQLRALASEVVQVVRVLHGLNRYRFRHDPGTLAAWTNARHVAAGPVGRRPSGEGDTRAA
jgi:hypothetical protein